MNCNILSVEAISYSIRRKQLLAPVTLNITSSKICGILGPNGAGKSTLLKTIAGIWAPTTGEVFWNGSDLMIRNRIEISRIISFVPQIMHIPFEFTVHDFVAMSRYSHNRRKLNAKDTDVIDWALRCADVWQFRNRIMNTLSHGERQRCYIARALGTESPVLLLDEPTASLDIRHQLEIWALLRKLADQGKAIAIASHDLVSAERYCEEYTILNRGLHIGTYKNKETFPESILNEIFGITRKKTGIFEIHQN